MLPLPTLLGVAADVKLPDADCLTLRQVVDPACGDRSPEIHNANLFDLNAKYADVVTEEEAVEHLKLGWA